MHRFVLLVLVMLCRSTPLLEALVAHPRYASALTRRAATVAAAKSSKAAAAAGDVEREQGDGVKINKSKPKRRERFENKILPAL